MEARGGAYIEIKIGVMHVMKTPEKRDHMVGPVPPPIAVTYQQKRCDHSTPRGHSKPVEQTDVFLLCPHRDGDRNWQHGETDDRESGQREDKIAHEPVQHLEVLATQWKAP